MKARGVGMAGGTVSTAGPGVPHSLFSLREDCHIPRHNLSPAFSVAASLLRLELSIASHEKVC